MRPTAFWITLIGLCLLPLIGAACSTTEEEELEAAIVAETPVVETIVLENKEVGDVLLDLRALLANPQHPQLFADEATNSLMVKGIPSEIEKVVEIIERLDVQG